MKLFRKFIHFGIPRLPYCRRQRLIRFHFLKQISVFLEPFPYFPVGGLSEWPANAHLPALWVFIAGGSTSTRRQGGPPNKHIAAIKGCFGNTSLTFPGRHSPHNSGAAKLCWIEMNPSALASYLQAGGFIICCLLGISSGTEHTSPALLPISADFDEMLGEHQAAIKCGTEQERRP